MDISNLSTLLGQIMSMIPMIIQLLKTLQSVLHALYPSEVIVEGT